MTAEPGPTKIFYVEPPKKPIIGIVGGIASGKTTVAAEFAKLGCSVIDADKIAHELLGRPDIQTAIIAVFGYEILDSDKKIDRRKLADIAFASPENLAKLNAILHPPVLARAEQLITTCQAQPDVKAIVLDIPLLTEVDWNNKCDRIIFVNAPQDVRARRARTKGIEGIAELKLRENFQNSLDTKANLADNVIENDSGLVELARQVAEIFSNYS